MKQKIYQIDAFTNKVFSGNPAAVCPLEKWLSNDVLQNIAMENNLAETAFYVKKGNEYQIRWFTPTVEVNLCGHATLATAFVLFNFENHIGNTINFHSHKSGALSVTKKDEILTLNFPTDKFEEIEISEDMQACFNVKPTKIFKGQSDYMFIFQSEYEIKNMIPYFDKISKLQDRGVIITAKGNVVDFVSRFFAPQSGIDEDPVTGSAHTTLIPYWTMELGKTKMSAIQLSKRRGYLECTYLKERVEISGQCSLYLIGEIFINQ